MLYWSTWLVCTGLYRKLLLVPGRLGEGYSATIFAEVGSMAEAGRMLFGSGRRGVERGSLITVFGRREEKSPFLNGSSGTLLRKVWA